MKKKLILPAVLLVWAASAGLAHATHIHFENYGEKPIAFDAANTNPNDLIYQSYTWKFDLNGDTMSLWVIPPDMVQNQAYDFGEYPDFFGNMDPEDILDYAYLTMQFKNVNDGNKDSDSEVIDLLLDTSTLLWNSVSITQGGTGKIDVTSRLYDDHRLEVTITAESGSFDVEFLDLSGCYEESAPVPEPATMLLFGTGLAGLARFARRKSRKG